MRPSESGGTTDRRTNMDRRGKGSKNCVPPEQHSQVHVEAHASSWGRLAGTTRFPRIRRCPVGPVQARDKTNVLVFRLLSPLKAGRPLPARPRTLRALCAGSTSLRCAAGARLRTPGPARLGCAPAPGARGQVGNMRTGDMRSLRASCRKQENRSREEPPRAMPKTGEQEA